MKKWVDTLIKQFDFDWNERNGRRGGDVGGEGPVDAAEISEERGTILYIIDTYNKHLVEIADHPVRKVREQLDEFAKEILNPGDKGLERVLFRFRQFFSAYRVDEYAYFQKTFEEFRTIVWDFVDQLSNDAGEEQKEDQQIRESLENLKEAVESNSIEYLKKHSRKFIDVYIEKQSKKEERRSKTMRKVRKNLNVVKKQLSDANTSLRTDHLTGSFNRKTFDEYCDQHYKLFQASKQPVSLMYVDIDHFKRINDTFGHPVGDFVLKELVQTLKGMFTREADLVARIGGEEFAILLPDFKADHAMKKAEEVLQKIRGQAYVHEDKEIRFTVSIGVAELSEGEEIASWIKRTDLALYNSKNTGRNKATNAPTALTRVA